TRLDSEEVAAVYTPLAQEVRGWKAWMNLVVRSSLDPAAQAAAIRRAVAQVDPLIPVAQVSTMERLVARSLGEPRLTPGLLEAFAGLALVLAALGIHAVVSYLVSLRTREIGVRLALGASGSDILGLVLREGLGLVAAGIVLGALGSLGLERLLRSWLFGVGAHDPTAFRAAAALLVAAAAAPRCLRRQLPAPPACRARRSHRRAPLRVKERP